MDVSTSDKMAALVLAVRRLLKRMQFRPAAKRWSEMSTLKRSRRF